MLPCNEFSKDQAHGLPCSWCFRPMDRNHPQLRPTRDHVVPRAHGGKQTVWACNQCNNLKGSMSYESWLIFRGEHPEYWKMTANQKRVAAKKKPWRRRVRHVSQVVVPPGLIYADRRLVHRSGAETSHPPMAAALAPLTE